MGVKRNGILAAVRADLASSPKKDSTLARTVLMLASRLDDPETPATAVAAMAKELRVALTDLGLEAKQAANPLDELRRKRMERRQQA
jgi:hypothetical protein